jgi:ribosome-binding protein aMBF1 (putative translation factor)
MNKSQKAIDFQKYLAAQLKKPRIKKYYDHYGKQLEIAYQILQLRKQKRMSQTQLAERLGTRQSNIARMEAGEQNFTTKTLCEIASIFNRNLEIEFVAR